MKAIQIESFGDSSVLNYTEVAKPELKPGEVIVRTKAAGVNPIDWKTCSGGGAAPFIGDLPFIPCWEFSGIVDEVAEDVTAFRPGDEVFGFIRFPEAAGCFAEYVAAPADEMALKPVNASFAEAAGLGLAGLTAWQALFDKGALQSGQKVVILAAAGGVGHLAVQLAKAAGATVIGTASSGNHLWLQEIGCDQVIDYRTQAAEEVINDADLVIDGMGGDTGIAALGCLKPGATLVTLPSVTKDQVIAAATAAGKQAMPIRVEANGEQLTKLSAAYDQGGLSLELANTYAITDVAKAFEESKTGHTKGKLVLTI